MERFFIDHKHIIQNTEELKKQLSERNTVCSYMDFALSIIQNFGSKVYVIIDEYDHFANDIIAKGGQLSKNQYKESIWANSVTKDFYETLKTGTKSVVDKIFVTGITPIMLDDLTSGFNISNNLSVDIAYSEILGLTSAEVDWVMEQIKLDKSLISIDIEKMYDGYLFHRNAKNKLFNSTMIFNFFHGFKKEGNDFEYLVDDNLKTDYGRIRNLINQHDNKDKLIQLIENTYVKGVIIKQFSIEHLHEDKNFFSLLYYMGLVTIDNSIPGRQILKIPNYSIKTIYWNLIESMLSEEIEGLSLDNSKYIDAIYKLTYENIYEPFFEYFSKYIVSYLSNRDLQGTVEKDMKFLLLPIFFTSNYYLPISELENSEGYTDIYLSRSHLHPQAVSEWVWELKYIKKADADNETLISTAQKDAIDQLQRYKTSNIFKDRTDVRYLTIVFIGKSKYIVTEV
jgi:hypothetical protein